MNINNIKNTLTCRTWKYYNGNETFDYVLAGKHHTYHPDFQLASGEIVEVNVTNGVANDVPVTTVFLSTTLSI